MNVTPTAAESAMNHDDPGRGNLAQKDPLVQPNNARPRNTLQQRLWIMHTSGEGVNLPSTCKRHPRHYKRHKPGSDKTQLTICTYSNQIPQTTHGTMNTPSTALRLTTPPC